MPKPTSTSIIPAPLHPLPQVTRSPAVLIQMQRPYFTNQVPMFLKTYPPPTTILPSNALPKLHPPGLVMGPGGMQTPQKPKREENEFLGNRGARGVTVGVDPPGRVPRVQ
ncbi:hypothetical protein BGX38DRAFT_1268245 [Terfezia claveryi]|nr:hypothetical protein BGX38DRAFT_1268245 [Terfezia claveryi]